MLLHKIKKTNVIASPTEADEAISFKKLGVN